MIPAWATHDLTLDVELRDTQGDRRERIRIEAPQFAMMWLPLVVLAPIEAEQFTPILQSLGASSGRRPPPAASYALNDPLGRLRA